MFITRFQIQQIHAPHGPGFSTKN